MKIKNIFLLLFLLIFFSKIYNAEVESVKTITDKKELAEIIGSNRKLAILFFGACHHCEPAKKLFYLIKEKFRESNIDFYQMKVNELPDVIEEQNIDLRPALITYNRGIKLRRLEREEITQESAITIVSKLLEYV